MSHAICMWHVHPLHMHMRFVMHMQIILQMYSWHPTSPASLGPTYNEAPGAGRKNVGPATVVSIAKDSTNEIVLTQMLVNGIHSLCCVIVRAPSFHHII